MNCERVTGILHGTVRSVGERYRQFREERGIRYYVSLLQQSRFLEGRLIPGDPLASQHNEFRASDLRAAAQKHRERMVKNGFRDPGAVVLERVAAKRIKINDYK